MQCVKIRFTFSGSPVSFLTSNCVPSEIPTDYQGSMGSWLCCKAMRYFVMGSLSKSIQVLDLLQAGYHNPRSVLFHPLCTHLDYLIT